MSTKGVLDSVFKAVFSRQPFLPGQRWEQFPRPPPLLPEKRSAEAVLESEAPKKFRSEVPSRQHNVQEGLTGGVQEGLVGDVQEGQRLSTVVNVIMRPHVNPCFLVKKNLKSIFVNNTYKRLGYKGNVSASERGISQRSQGRSVGNSQTKLGKSDFRSVGVTDSTGLQSRSSYSAHSIIPSETSAFARKARGTYEGKDKKFIRKRGHREGKGPTASSVDLTDVPHPKKGRSNEASVQSKRSESVPTLATFQNGKHTDDQRPHPGRRLDGENGSEGCLLCPANQTEGSEVVEIPMEVGDL